VIDIDSGRVYGTVSDITDVPRGQMYTIETKTGEVLFPAVKEFLKDIRPDEGIFIRPIPGFFEDEK
jgi:ribosomal 30S subunit maturation factor RimM